MGLKKKVDNFLSSLINNRLLYDYYYDTIKELSITRYEWKNLPPEIDARFLELILFEMGTVAFFQDDVTKDYIVQPYTDSKKFNKYRIPAEIQAYSVNGIHWDLDLSNSVII